MKTLNLQALWDTMTARREPQPALLLRIRLTRLVDSGVFVFRNP